MPSMAYSATVALVHRWSLPSTDSSAVASPSSVDMRAFHGRSHGLPHGRCDRLLRRHRPAPTPPAHGNDLTGVAELSRVEDLPQAVHDLEVVIAEQPGHAVLFFQPNAVLTT